MVCPVKTREEYAAPSYAPYAPSHSTAISCAPDFVYFQKRGVPFFSGIVTDTVTIARYYSPELGRWCSREPLGELGGYNLYQLSELQELYGLAGTPILVILGVLY